MALCLFLASKGAMAAETILEYKGSASRITPEFEVKAPWILDWRVTTDGNYESAVDVSLEEAGTGVHQGRVLMTKFPGNGVRLFDQGGRFYFRVNSAFATWTLKVQELTPEEAALYTPRDDSALDTN
jgi:hypothetical protein